MLELHKVKKKKKKVESLLLVLAMRYWQKKK